VLYVSGCKGLCSICRKGSSSALPALTPWSPWEPKPERHEAGIDRPPSPQAGGLTNLHKELGCEMLSTSSKQIPQLLPHPPPPRRERPGEEGRRQVSSLFIFQAILKAP
jgi:hypothetical protein